MAANLRAANTSVTKSVTSALAPLALCKLRRDVTAGVVLDQLRVEQLAGPVEESVTGACIVEITVALGCATVAAVVAALFCHPCHWMAGPARVERPRCGIFQSVRSAQTLQQCVVAHVVQRLRVVCMHAWLTVILATARLAPSRSK